LLCPPEDPSVSKAFVSCNHRLPLDVSLVLSLELPWE
jgi:hypothetical protein